MSFFQTLWASGPATPLSRYITWNGLLYVVSGALVYAWPEVTQLLGADDFQAGEAGLVRILGFVMAVIGWFYLMGARTRADSFGLATVVDRLIVPFFLLAPVVAGAVDAGLVVPFAILDPVLGLGALAVWLRTRQPVAVA